ncbi:MAG: SseB family protein [Paracoccaceae bacterium]
MDEFTELDRAHTRMEADDADVAARLSFYERLADTEFFMLLEKEPDANSVIPRVFPFSGQDYVLIFDREQRLAEFVGDITPYVALSGRAIVNMLAGQGIGLGVNLDVAPSSILIPDDAVAWLLGMLAQGTEVNHDQPAELRPPIDVPEALLQALNTKLALAMGMAQTAFLVRALYTNGRSGLLLGIIDAAAASEPALSQAVSEALVFSGLENETLDVAFFKPSESICANLAKVGLRFDIPKVPDKQSTPTAPGMDPDLPPRLR